MRSSHISPGRSKPKGFGISLRSTFFLMLNSGFIILNSQILPFYYFTSRPLDEFSARSIDFIV